MKALKLFALAWIQGRAFEAAYQRLRRLSDHDLDDLGLRRAEIVQAALQQSERHVAPYEAAFETQERFRGTAALHGAMR